MASVTEVANDTAVAVVDAVMPGVADADAVKTAVGSELG